MSEQIQTTTKQRILELLRQGIPPEEVVRQLQSEGINTKIEYVYKIASEARKTDPSIPKFNRDALKKMMLKADSLQTGGVHSSHLSSSHVQERREAAKLLISGFSEDELISSEHCSNLDFEEILEIAAKVKLLNKNTKILGDLKSLGFVDRHIETLSEAIASLVNHNAMQREKIERIDSELGETKLHLARAMQNEKHFRFELQRLEAERTEDRYRLRVFNKAAERYGSSCVLQCCRAVENLQYYRQCIRNARNRLHSLKREAESTSRYREKIIRDAELDAERKLSLARQLQKAMVNSEDVEASIADTFVSSPEILSTVLWSARISVWVAALKIVPAERRARIYYAFAEADRQEYEEKYEAQRRKIQASLILN
jgi:hypothetical protein